MISKRLRTDHLLINGSKNFDIILWWKGGQRWRRVHEFHFWPRNWPTLFYFTWSFLEEFEISDNFRWAKKLNCEYKYLVNRTQLSRKQWSWQLLWVPSLGFNSKKSIFSIFDIIWVIRRRGYCISVKFSPCNSFGS